MTEESVTGTNSDASQSRQRKKRKWDQPAKSLVSAGITVPGIVPLGNMGSLAGIALPGVASVAGTLLVNPLVTSCATIPLMPQIPSMPQNAPTAVQKPIQPKIQDDLVIAREIVINDAEPSVRYKLTKRQTQEEIQKCTGSVVITRGKYRPANALPDSEKPLYLHISAGAHLKDTAERILAVDRAAAMVEEMLKLGHSLNAASIFPMTACNAAKALSTSVFLGFDADPSLNIPARIRGPNDQYINHIMNETGATVTLRGRGSGNFEMPNGAEAQHPLHLFLSASNSKSLDDAKRLAENLLDTISLECGATRVSSCKVYNAIPPPQQLQTGVQNYENEQNKTTISNAGLAVSAVSSTVSMPASSDTIPGASIVFSQGTMVQSGGTVNSGPSIPDVVGYSPLVTGVTSYSGYEGIYPQATPLQQVAQVLRQSVSPVTSTGLASTSVANTTSKLNTSSISEKEKQSTQRRKFQELPIGSKGFAKPHQGLEMLKPCEQSNLGVRNITTMLAPKKLVPPSSNGMPPAPLQTMPPPPPPPKFTSLSPAAKLQEKNHVLENTKSDSVPDTLVKLMEYGDDEDDDPEENSVESLNVNVTTAASIVQKPFWAV